MTGSGTVNRFLLISLCCFCITCNNSLPEELVQLNQIIDRYFGEIHTAKHLISRSTSIRLGRAPFHQLIKNGQISEKDFNQIKHYIENSPSEAVLNIPLVIDARLEEIIQQNQLDTYQRFGYPILTKDILIIYRESFEGLLNAKTLGIIGSGEYHFYRKKPDEWVRMMSITKWIT